jgi:ABC-type sugar transport system ATPase subunit
MTRDHAIAAPTSDQSAFPLISLVGATKRYHGVAAIEGVDLTLERGEIHALVGENGAGKSTLCKVLSGVVQLDEGQLSINGAPVTFKSPRDALQAGIAMVYQETSLVPTMTVGQNIELGHESAFNRLSRVNIGAQQLLRKMNFHVDPTVLVSSLGAAKKQMVEIGRALRADARVVVFDEPTATLTPEERLNLFYVMSDLRDAGVGIIFVTHALEEALSVSDRISVLRDGLLQTTRQSAELSRDEIVRQMVGRSIELPVNVSSVRSREIHDKVLRVENLTMGTTVKSMTFSAYRGEILGLAGLIGSGRTETAQIIAGMRKRNRINGGRILLHDRPVRYRHPQQAIRDGIAYITEDRKLDGFFETASVEENIYLGAMAKHPFRRMVVSRRNRRRLADGLIAKLNIRAINAQAKVVELSGGNQQKVTVAKSLVQDPEVVIFDEPTRGVDVGAITEIHDSIRAMSGAGKVVIVISSYLPEILAISDRILVARNGRIAAEFGSEDATEEKIMYAAVH